MSEPIKVTEFKVKEIKKSAVFEVIVEESCQSGQTGRNHKVTFKYSGEPKEGVAILEGVEIPIVVLDKAIQAYKEQHPYEME
jgi:hypothetical protein